MTADEHLPEDIERWPASPFVLLNVDPGASQQQVKSAYARLIRIYKPDHFPDQFQRIRQAYHDALGQGKHGSHFTFDGQIQRGEEGEHPLGDVLWTTPARRSGRSHPEAGAGSAADPADPIDDNFGSLAGKNRAICYQGLVDRLKGHPSNDEDSIKLYWLLRIDPELEIERQPCDWLVDWLQQNNLFGRVYQMYLQELRHNLQEGISERCLSLIACCDDPDRRLELLKRRWCCSHRVGRHELVVEDTERLRQDVDNEFSIEWARVLFAAVDHLAWGPGGSNSAEGAPGLDRFAAYVDEVEQCAEGHVALAHEFDRLDTLVLLRAELLWWQTPTSKGLVELPEQMRQMVADSWVCDFEDIQPRLLSWIAAWARSPTDGLRVFTDLTELADMVAGQLSELIDMLATRICFPRRCGEPTEFTRHRIRWLLADFPRSNSELRGAILDICRHEAISVDVFVELARQEQDTTNRETARALSRILQDRPLKSIATVCAIFGD